MSRRSAVLLLLIVASTPAFADVSNAGVLDAVLQKFADSSASWGTAVTTYASGLFWSLTTISMVWTFGQMALRRADIGEFFAELVRFTVFTGFFWWLLSNGPAMAKSIIDSMKQMGGSAAGVDGSISPSGIVDIGFAIFFKVLDASSVWSPVDSAAGIALALIILICLALIAINMLVMLITAWFLAGAGVFYLGFGGSRWTSDMAITYYKTVLSIATQVMAMVMLAGIGKGFIDDYYNNLSGGTSLKELAVVMVAAIALLILVNKVPALMGQLAFGGGTGSHIGSYGSGTALAAIGMAGAAGGVAASMMGSAAANIAGGASALREAVSSAVADASEGEGGGSSGKSGAGGESGAGSLSEAMGGGGAGAAANDNSPASGGASGGAGGGSSGTSGGGDTAQAGASTDEGAGGEGGSGGSGSSANEAGNSGGGSATEAQAPNGGGTSGGGDGEASSDDAAATATTPSQAGGASGAAGGGGKGGLGSIAMGAMSHLGRGIAQVAKAKADAVAEAAQARIGETLGGQIAEAIRQGREGTATADDNARATFDGNGLGGNGNSDSAAQRASTTGEKNGGEGKSGKEESKISAFFKATADNRTEPGEDEIAQFRERNNWR